MKVPAHLVVDVARRITYASQDRISLQLTLNVVHHREMMSPPASEGLSCDQQRS